MTFTTRTRLPTPIPNPFGKTERLHGVVDQKAPNNVREPQKIAMKILQDQRESFVLPDSSCAARSPRTPEDRPRTICNTRRGSSSRSRGTGRGSRESAEPEKRAESSGTSSVSGQTTRAGSCRKARANKTVRYRAHRCNGCSGTPPSLHRPETRRRPRKTAVGESHQASRRDVWPNLPFFQTTSGADTSPSMAEGFEDGPRARRWNCIL